MIILRKNSLHYIITTVISMPSN